MVLAAIGASGATEVVAGGANGGPALWVSADGGSAWIDGCTQAEAADVAQAMMDVIRCALAAQDRGKSRGQHELSLGPASQHRDLNRPRCAGTEVLFGRAVGREGFFTSPLEP